EPVGHVGIEVARGTGVGVLEGDLAGGAPSLTTRPGTCAIFQERDVPQLLAHRVLDMPHEAVARGELAAEVGSREVAIGYPAEQVVEELIAAHIASWRRLWTPLPLIR